MRRYFCQYTIIAGRLQITIAVAESPLTAQGAERYSAAQGWYEVNLSQLRAAWQARDRATLAALWPAAPVVEVAPVVPSERSVGGHIV